MRDAIARALAWALATLAPRCPGRHSVKFLAARPQDTGTAPAVAPASPWSRPWTSPTKEEAAAIFRRQDAATLQLRLQWERRTAAALAAQGIDYPYTYDGAPFSADSFATREASA
ncbi:MAG TPA: hypothetical protein VIU15_24975 [Streptomyces sp.]